MVPINDRNNTQSAGTKNRLFRFIANHPKQFFSVFLLIVPALIIAVTVLASTRRPSRCSSSNTTCCPDDWIGHHGTCFYMSAKEGNWKSSQDSCASYSASLLKMSRKEEPLKAFIMLQRGTSSIWIGLRNLNGTWRWSDGEEERDMKIRGNGGDCAYLDQEGTATTSRCTTPHHWICSKPAMH